MILSEKVVKLSFRISYSEILKLQITHLKLVKPSFFQIKESFSHILRVTRTHLGSPFHESFHQMILTTASLSCTNLW